MKRKKLIGYFIFISVWAVVLTACTKESEVYLDSQMDTEVLAEAVGPVSTEEPARCYVYVCGAVKNPGVYELSQDSRVSDAIALAGGFTEEAAPESYNLAEKVTDEQKIQILTETEIEKQTAEAASEVASDGKVNLNTATAAELMTLPGVGQAKADAIISYREEHGQFETKEDVMNVSGIKEGVFAKMKDSIIVN